MFEKAGIPEGRYWFRAYAFLLTPILILLSPRDVNAANLDPATLRVWEKYVESVNMRMGQRLLSDKTFLWVDDDPSRLAKVRAGAIVVESVGSLSPKRVQSGLIHHWVGAVYIPNVGIKDALAVTSDYAHYKEFYQPTVIDSKALITGDAKSR